MDSATTPRESSATDVAPVTAVGAGARAPLSFSQQRLWVLDRLLPARWVYNIARAWRLLGDLDVDALKRAWNELARRHDVLRTSFVLYDGKPAQHISQQIELDWDEHDLSALPRAEREAEAHRLAREAAQAEFHLDRAPLFRIRLLRLAPHEHWLLFTVHHIVSDGWSSAVVAREISTLYAAFRRGEASPLPELSLQYADFASWQRQWLQGEVLERQLAYWRRALVDAPVLALPTDRPRPALPSYRGGRVSFELNEALTRALKSLGRQEGSTLFMLLLAAFQVVLSRWTGQDDICVGFPIAGRPRPELDGLIGFFVNTLVLRGDLSGDPSFREHLRRVRDRALDAYAHQDVPFEKLVEGLAPDRDPARNPLFQAAFAFHNTAPAEWVLPELDLEDLDAVYPVNAKFDLTLAVREADGALRARLDYAADLFDAGTAERMARDWTMLLEDAVAHPDLHLSRLRRADDSAPKRAPASIAQRALWLLCQTLPDHAVYNESNVFRLRGVLDVEALSEALSEIVRRHEALRTRFRVVDGEPMQEIVARQELSLALVDLGALAEGEREAEARRCTREEVRARFDLERGPLLRARLLRLGRDEHWLLLTMHHIVRDGTSNVILARELSALYRACRAGRPSPLPEPRAQYADYARWQRAWLRGQMRKEQLAYWKRALAELPVLQLPTDRPRPPEASYRGGRVSFELGGELLGGLRTLAHGEETTLFTLLLAALQVLLYRYSGQEDVAVGVPVAGRNRPEFAGSIGYFVNLLVLRGQLGGEPTFREYLGRVRQRTHEAYAHQELPFATLVQQLARERDRSRNPLFQVSLAKGTEPGERPELEGLEVEDLGIRGPETAKFDLHFSVAEERGRIAGEIEYATDLFDSATVERMAEHWRILLEDIVAHPDRPVSRLLLADDAVRRRAIVEWNDTRAEYPGEQGVAALFAAQVRATPTAVAVIDGEATLSYAALDRRGRALARRLRELGVSPGARVGVCIERSTEQIVAVLGVLMAGCAYVPFDPGHPPERLALLLASADAAAVVAVRASLRALASAQAASARPIVALDDAEGDEPTERSDTAVARGGDDLAYIMYTSGSTGEPKGVAVPHRAIVRLVRGTDYVHLDASDVVAHLANPAFDASTFDVWGALLNGARVAVIPRNDVLSPRDLANTLDRHAVTILFLTTALFNQIAREAPHAFSGREVLFGGEAADPRSVAAALREGRPGRLLHVYGPTEATTFATWHEVRGVDPDATTVPIGRPIANTEVYLLDRDGEPVPPGVPGEIHIGGPGLALGYYGRPDLTAERFIAHPFDPTHGARLFRTGDRARYRGDGSIEFLGRLDRQVKIRGHRIEPAEVEAALLQLPQLSEAVVVVHGDRAETRRLTAYVVPVKGNTLAVADVRRELGRILPAYMLPGAIGILSALPLTPNGKVDRTALPSPEDLASGRTRWRLPPGDPLQHMLAAIWEELLGVRNIGIRDSFFDLGGHSLLAAQMMDAVNQACGCSVPLTTLFSEPTIEKLARALRGQVASSTSAVVAIRATGARPPFFFLHGDFSGGGFYCHALSRELGSEQPFYAVHPHGLEAAEIPDSIEAMAGHLVREVRRVRPNGPYLLGGHCNGGLVAVEMARQLAAEGEQVPLVVVLDARVRAGPGEPIQDTADTAPALTPGPGFAQSAAPKPDSPSDIFVRYRRAIAGYAPGRYPGRIAVLRSARTRDKSPDLGWSSVSEHVEIYVIPGSHHTSITRHVATTGARIRACLEAAGE